MSNIFLYAHGGSGNHGCEAIVRSTIKMLSGHNITLISSNPEEDVAYGIDQLCTIIKDREEKLNKCSLDFLKAYASLKLHKDFIPLEKLHYKKAFSHIKKGDIALSIGGDNYCYADVYKYRMFHEIAKSRGAKTVLWGCSVEPEILKDPVIANDIRNYDLITARETLSYNALKEINSNTELVSDPAFSLDTKYLPLPEGFKKNNTVGINLSPMVIERESVSGIAYENYINLISYIIEHTNMQIALIPHVIWKDGDDRIPLKKMYNEFSSTNRVVMIENHNCHELKYIISQCRFFIGARTHSTIAAYSSYVPTLVLGYSIKARGIARDLFGDNPNYILPVNSLFHKTQLLNEFKLLMENEKEVIKQLKTKMPTYVSQCNII